MIAYALSVLLGAFIALGIPALLVAAIAWRESRSSFQRGQVDGEAPAPAGRHEARP